MVRGRDFMRLPVITRDDGRKIGQVEDFIIDRNGTRVLGILVDEKGVFGSARVVAWPGIWVSDSTWSSSIRRRAWSRPPRLRKSRRFGAGFRLVGNRVETTTGRELGKVENFFFNPSTGAVEGFELIGGRNEQALSGQAFLPASPSFEAGKEYSFVDSSAADAIMDLKTALESRRG